MNKTAIRAEPEAAKPAIADFLAASKRVAAWFRFSLVNGTELPEERAMMLEWLSAFSAATATEPEAARIPANPSEITRKTPTSARRSKPKGNARPNETDALRAGNRRFTEAVSPMARKKSSAAKGRRK